MNKATRTARNLSRRLRVLDTTNQLATVVGGGQSATTSRSGTPEAGDDTVGDNLFEYGGGALLLRNTTIS